MKKIYVCLVTSLLICLTACTSDDNDPMTPDESGEEVVIPDEESGNALEETDLDATTVSNGITIEGGTKKFGYAPKSHWQSCFFIRQNHTICLFKEWF